ncbi:MAG: dihydroorotate dehydrogenase electron transfer subunit [Pirellulales bacterium]|nr:dihydroorotate dehydrogenase electron transfer subunit [Pirellulales bacterium]
MQSSSFPTDSGRSVFYADKAHMETARILDHRSIAEQTYRLRMECPTIADRIVPGQFVMLRIPACNDPLLGRPLALYDTVFDPAGRVVGLDIVYCVIGKMTRLLAGQRSGDPIDVWGPLGNGFPPLVCRHLLLVAGGIGQTPFYSLAKERLGQKVYGNRSRSVPRVEKVTLCYGVRSANFLAGVAEFQDAGIQVEICTEDGSIGHRGLVTESLQAILSESNEDCHIVCCGPEPMLEATARIAATWNVPCDVSLETPMACGIGLCFSCVVKIRQPDGGWDYQRACVHGPVFDATKIVW